MYVPSGNPGTHPLLKSCKKTFCQVEMDLASTQYTTAELTCNKKIKPVLHARDSIFDL
jgi:hypothetical protein